MRSEFRLPVVLEHGDIRLRLIQYSDKAAWTEIKMANEDWLTPWDATNPAGGVRVADFRKYVRRMRAEARNSISLPLVIEYQGRMVGQITLGNVVWGSLRQGYIGYWIDGRVAGRGIMPTALALLLDHAILYLQLHRVEINIRPENTASLRVVEKLGIPFEGIRRKYLHIAGDWRDHHAYVAIADEYPSVGLRTMRPLSH